MTIDEAPLTAEDIAAFRWRIADAGSRLVAMLASFCAVLNLFFWWAGVTAAGAAVGLLADPHGTGVLIGAGIGALGYALLLAVASAADHL